ncbi:MAG: DUF551 domain-containing protein [Lachnospiraceae bacterium]|nr:DUF551 domain-containing protein [Lachnospiraceae bacterium]
MNSADVIEQRGAGMIEAIDALKKYADGKKNTEKVEISVLQLNRIIKALEGEFCKDKIIDEHYQKGFDNGIRTEKFRENKRQEPRGDAISRQAVLDHIYGVNGLEEFEFSNVFEKHYADFIKSLPPVTPKSETEWIPVSEGFPKDEQDVLIQYGNSIFVGYHKRDFTVYGPGFEDLDETGWYDEHDEFVDDSDSITAWMPLPELYKQTKSEKEIESEENDYDR